MIVTDDATAAHAAAGHPERPQRLDAIRRRIEADPVLARIARRAAEPATESSVLAVHPRSHLDSLARLSRAGGGWIDADTYCSPGSYEVALRAAGAATAAVDAVVAGAGFGFALARPPGHHAEADRAMGFCLVNNAAIAVRHAQRERGLGRVAVIDIDVHHGNGTEALVDTDPTVLYTSLHQLPLFPGTGVGSVRGSDLSSSLNVPLPPGTGGDAWLAALREEIVPAVDRFEPELIIVSAGYDAHVADPLAALELRNETYGEAAAAIGRLGNRHGRRGTVWLLEGGYDLDALAGSVAASLHALLAAG